ncbi:MAG TPA: DUF4337 domain-containing protein [Terracidiphilus sp.]|nr:DUF4337 domain-containing protein [Terracidiphilus sp.]
MEANEVQELKEQAEKGGESAMRPVAFTMSVVAVLVAITTVLGHRTHTEAVLFQNQATDQWNEYQARHIRSHDTELASNMLANLAVTDKAAAAKLEQTWKDAVAKSTQDQKEDRQKAEELQEKVEKAEARADRYDLSEALLEIGLVVTSVTLLTRSRIYWYLGILFSVTGILSAISVLFLN